MYENMLHYVKDFLEKTSIGAAPKFPFRDRFEHTLRVYKWALRINEVEQGDTEILSIAAIFHDIGKWVKSDQPHASVGAELCGEYLKAARYPEDKRIRVVNAIRHHSSKSAQDLDLSLEDKILIDADLLDEVGALAIAWDCMATGLEENASYLKACEKLKDVYGQLCKQKPWLRTPTGAKLFQERLDFLQLFIKNLEYELGLS